MDLSNFGVKWSEYIPHDPNRDVFPKQFAFLLLPHREAFYGGAAGGGKSEALLIAALQYCDTPGYSAILFRRTLTDLKQPQALLARANNWLAGHPHVSWVGSEHCYYFKTWYPDGTPGLPARLQFGYIGAGNAASRYKSAEFQFCGFDELTTFDQADYEFMFSRLRRIKCTEHSTAPNPNCYRCQSSAKVPIRMRSASNPGDIGHGWVKKRFAIGPKEINGVIRYVGNNPGRPYIAANFRDNPHVDADQYELNLREMDPVSRERFMNGDWGVSQDSRFKIAWFKRYSFRAGYYILGEDGIGPGCLAKDLDIFQTVDTAASAKEGPGDEKRFKISNPSWTVIATWGRTPDNHLLLLDVVRIRVEIPQILTALLEGYRRWRPNKIAMEAVGTGKGAFQMARQRGLPVFPLHPHTDKIVRSTEAQVRAEQGRIWLPQLPGPAWLSEWEGEVSSWTGDPGEQDDQIDTLSDAAKMVSWDAAGIEMAEQDLSANDSPGVIQMPGFGVSYDPTGLPYSFM